MRNRIECDVWICEHQDCNHFWLATSVAVPEKCPKCSRRKWHQTASTAELIRSKVAPVALDGDLDARMEAIARRVFREEWESVPAESDVPSVTLGVTADVSSVTANVPDLSAAPLADKLAVARAALASVGAVAALQPVAVALGPCPVTAEYMDTGEWFACSREAGHKGQHNRGAKVSPPDDF